MSRARLFWETKTARLCTTHVRVRALCICRACVACARCAALRCAVLRSAPLATLRNQSIDQSIHPSIQPTNQPINQSIPNVFLRLRSVLLGVGGLDRIVDGSGPGEVRQTHHVSSLNSFPGQIRGWCGSHIMWLRTRPFPVFAPNRRRNLLLQVKLHAILAHEDVDQDP